MAVKNVAPRPGALSSASSAANLGASRRDWMRAIGKSTQVAPTYFDQKIVGNRGSSEVDYAEFLSANPRDREKFDPSGKTIRESINIELRGIAEAAYDQHRDASFNVHGTVNVDGSHKEYPAPTTPYWQRALGHHKIKLTATVRAEERETELVLWIIGEIVATPIASSEASPPFAQRGKCMIKIEHHVPKVPKGQKA